MRTPALRVAVPSPLRRTFDYLAPSDPPAPGCRVRVPFGRRSVVGVVLECNIESNLPAKQLRPLEAVLDREPLLGRELLALLVWAGAYYQHPPGEVLATALPTTLRQGQPATASGVVRWELTPAGEAVEPNALARSPRQAAALALLREYPEGAVAETLGGLGGNWRDTVRRLEQKGWVGRSEGSALPPPLPNPGPAPTPSPAQEQAIAAVTARLGGFGAFLLDGVTGSGKTEVYLRIIEAALTRGEQALVLVPEIGLTPQLVDRFRRRLTVPVAVLHSGLNDSERLNAWLAARDGSAPVVIGTRSAIFTPLARPGVILVDEEHDTSFKQQDGFRYSARDLATVRASRADIPIVLGSATPSLESLHNARSGRYVHLRLPERTGTAKAPPIRLLDVRARSLDRGLSPRLAESMEHHLAAGGQVLLFLNRRGYAPALLCHACGWSGLCERCDMHMTLHAGQRRLRCHHCGVDRPAPPACPECGAAELLPVGHGTERIEEVLAERFPDVERVRIDRDSTRRKGALAEKLESARSGHARILVGTQMLAKGHHFPGVTLVGIIDADQGLFSADFRAGERMAQLVTQVAGRAGRADRPGEVLLQTHHPDHPLLQTLVTAGYAAFAEATLSERQAAGWPPFSHLALLRAEAATAAPPSTFLEEARATAQSLGAKGVYLLGPVPAPMERRAGRFRAQLLLQAERRTDLHRLLNQLAPALENLKSGRRVRWSLDVDPVDMY